MIVEKDLLCSFIGTHNTGSSAGETACNPSARPRAQQAALTPWALLGYARNLLATQQGTEGTGQSHSRSTPAWCMRKGFET